MKVCFDRELLDSLSDASGVHRYSLMRLIKMLAKKTGAKLPMSPDGKVHGKKEFQPKATKCVKCGDFDLKESFCRRFKWRIGPEVKEREAVCRLEM